MLLDKASNLQNTYFTDSYISQIVVYLKYWIINLLNIKKKLSCLSFLSKNKILLALNNKIYFLTVKQTHSNCDICFNRCAVHYCIKLRLSKLWGDWMSAYIRNTDGICEMYYMYVFFYQIKWCFKLKAPVWTQQIILQ